MRIVALVALALAVLVTPAWAKGLPGLPGGVTSDLSDAKIGAALEQRSR